MKPVFVETENVSRFRRAMRNLEDTEKGQPGIGVVSGQAGRGKTFAAENYHAENGGVFLRVWQDWTQTAFLQALCFEVKGERPHSANRCKIAIMEALERDRQTLIIDEADRLNVKRIEDLRDIHDQSGAPIVLIGEAGLQPLLSSRRRIWSRVTQEVVFGPVSEMDVLNYAARAAGLKMSPEAARILKKKSGGDFRLIHTMMIKVEQASRAAQTQSVDADLVTKATARGRKI
ncbi:AAA family ATPase [Desulfoplanes formicivorans]|uniref:DNA transposition protein n=1 Tax=Desulfoplanes formicivorans TaxID=1592317 RepID=A0A194AFK4_9BACT|nr:AAA family ATPase [Desulfoplanes formicivorans]GAU08113.1 DNA transposition protein [Desulfoplanes formicivorans]